MDTLEKRLDKIERQNRRRGLLLLLTAGAATAALAGGAGQAPNFPEVIRAQRFELVTAIGQRVADLSFNADLDCGELTLYSSGDIRRVKLGAEATQHNGMVEIYAQSGRPLGGFYADDKTGSGAMALLNPDGNVIHYVSGDENGNAVANAYNRLGKRIFRQGATPKDAGWISVGSADGRPLVQGGIANADGHGVLMLARADGKPAMETKAYADLAVMSLYDSLGRARTRVVASTEHGARVAAVTPDGQNWNFWPEAPESAVHPTGLNADPLNSILNGGGQ